MVIKTIEANFMMKNFLGYFSLYIFLNMILLGILNLVKFIFYHDCVDSFSEFSAPYRSFRKNYVQFFILDYSRLDCTQIGGGTAD